MVNLRKGNIVTVKNCGATFTTFTEMFNRLNFTDKKYNDLWVNGEMGEVFDIYQHPNTLRTLVAIRHDDGRECLIGIEGIKYISERKIFKLKRKK